MRDTFHSNEELIVAGHEWLPMQESSSNCDGIFNLMLRWVKFHHYTQGLCWRIMILQWNRWATF